MSKSTPDPRLVFLDLETTGLDPERCHILEIGVVIVDPATLEPLRRPPRVLDEQELTMLRRCVLEPPWGYYDAAARKMLGDYVFEMHTKSGLLEALESQGYLLTAAEQQICDVLHDAGIPYGSATLAGFCPQFDMAFLKRHMPTLAGWFDYRHVDVSTLRGLVRRWASPEIDDFLREKNGETKHRTIEDCYEAISELQFYRQFIDVEKIKAITKKEGA